MRSVRSRNTLPEVVFRKALSSRGIRYRPYSTQLPGKPDIVLRSKKLAVFIDGDFWHGGQWSRRSLSSLEEQFTHTRSKRYWLNKISRNVDRDLKATATLLKNGWTVLRFWESDLKKNLANCLEVTASVARDGVAQESIAVAPDRTVAEFFAGIGLMRLGLEGEGWGTLFANDIDPQKREMYEAHFGGTKSCCTPGDIHTLSADNVPTVTLATASFPCNDLSLAGSRAGLCGKQSSAFWGFIHILRRMGDRRPPLVLLENVPGFLTSHGGEDFEAALLALNQLNYRVDAFIVDAARFVPQSRQRLFVVGIQSEEIHGAGWLSEMAPSDVRPTALADYMQGHKDIAWSIRNLPALPKSVTRIEQILEDLPDSAPEWWSGERATYLLSQMSRRHREIAERMIENSQWSYGTVFRRVRNGKSMAELRTDGLAGCLRTPRGGSGRQILFKAGKGKYFARLLTPRECSRLMGADDFTIVAPLNQALFGFGDAVCVPVIQWIAKHYLNPVVSELIRGRPLYLEKELASVCR